jgi:TolA-binding protein
MNRTRTKVLNLKTKKLCILAISVIFLSLFVYLYSYQLSVSHVARVEETKDKIANVKSSISELEFQIVEGKRKIDKEVAQERGFVELKEVVFVKKSIRTALNAVSN